MRNKHFMKCFYWIIIFMLMAGLSGPTGGVKSSEVNAQSLLVELAAREPQRTIRVIAQMSPGTDGLEAQVARLGGRVVRELAFIHAVAAEMTAEAAVELSKLDSVRWVSLDAPVANSVDDPEPFITWATAVGFITTNSFINNALVVDSSLGPNGTFGYGANVKGAFTGFSAQVVPGTSITKVELILVCNTPLFLGSAQDPIITPWVGGVAGKSLVLNHNAINNFIGEANTGSVYVDITGLRSWTWADFESDLQIVIDQTKFKTTSRINYDAIGLRVTSSSGYDTSIDSLTISAEADSTIDGSKQVNVYNQVIGAPLVWNTTKKLQGKGIRVAVVDSGIAKTVELKKRVKVNINFNSSFHDSSDRYGHGTYVAGIIAGNGTQSNGKYIGVAPKTDLLNIRISDDYGMMYESDVIASLQWIYENKEKFNIRVVNLSLNSSVAQSYHTSPLCAAVEILWFNQIVVVVSAGNNGSSTLYPPANDPFVITVGATDDRGTLTTSDDVVATFSAYGVTEDGHVKPDLVAPGRLIIGVLPENNKLTMSKDHPANRVDNTYFKMSGTSVSAPMVSGAVAILLQDEPDLTPDQVKYRLVATANKNWPNYSAAAGAGYLNIYDAVNATTTESANTGVYASQLLASGDDPVAWNSVGWNSVGWNSVGWNSVGWNSVGWNSVGWNSTYWEP